LPFTRLTVHFPKSEQKVAAPLLIQRAGNARDYRVTDDYRAAFEAARRQVASAERVGRKWGGVVEAIRGLARSARHIDADERQKVLTQLDQAAGAAESQNASRVMHYLRLAERELP
jgi:hypothetical protein